MRLYRFYLYAAAHDIFYIALDVAELENFKETFVRDYSVFYALRRAVRKEGVAQRIKAVGVAEHERRLVKCPGEVLPSGRLTPVLPPTEESTAARRVVGI